jgi:hypothetical protein
MTFRRLIESRYATAMALVLLVMQLIVASSTLMIAGLARDVSAGVSGRFHLIGLIVSLSTPYLPGLLALYLQKLWHVDAYHALIQRSSSALRASPALWRDATQKEHRTGILTAAGPGVLSSVTLYVHDFISTALNLFLGIAGVVWAIGPELLWGFAIGILPALLLLRVMLPRIEAAGTAIATAQASLNTSLMSMWDNVVLGNRLNGALWHKHARVAVNNYRTWAIRSVMLQDGIAVAASLIMMAPTLALLSVDLSGSSTSAGDKLAMIALLPRVFLIFNMAQQFLSFLSGYGSIRGQLAVLRDVESTPPGPSLLGARINAGQIGIAVGGAPSMIADVPADALIERLASRTRGRITVEGRNGSGKSSLLLAIKERLGDAAVMLPTKHHLLFTSVPPGASTGERTKAELSELIASSPGCMLLLDEWDANLDSKNAFEVSQCIDEVSRHVVVIEVRHRKSADIKTANAS